MLVLVVAPAYGADKADIAKIEMAVKASPTKETKPPITKVVLPRTDKTLGDMTLYVFEKDGKTHFGVQALYNVGAKESNYEMDTPCWPRLTDYDSRGVVSGIEWGCIAYTTTMQEFVNNNAQRVFDQFVAEAKTLLNIK
ncbi:hypothetical protein HY413_03765 [Candidatus Kaiserbacteria bacterium]|nr:hypothetical protein [Candidatus Kaiserbacteria bacterium]